MTARHLVRFGLLATLVGAGLGAGSSEARPGWVSGTYVYADLCTLSEDGAQTGRRVTLKRWPTGDNLVYEGAGLPAPIETAVTVDDATKNVAFELQTRAGLVRFRGTAEPDALVGTLHSADGSEPVRLKRMMRSRAPGACPGETTGSIN